MITLISEETRDKTTEINKNSEVKVLMLREAKVDP